MEDKKLWVSAPILLLVTMDLMPLLIGLPVFYVKNDTILYLILFVIKAIMFLQACIEL